MKLPVKILYLEDNLNDVELVRSFLVKGGISCDLVQVETRTDFIHALEQSRFDLILVDYSLPQFDGLSALAIAREKCPDVPFILVSGAIGEELAVKMLKEGATDYVLKSRLSHLVPAVNRALREAEERAERKIAEERLQRSEEYFRAVIENSSDIIIIVDKKGTITYTSPSIERFLGYKPKELIGKSGFNFILPADLPRAIFDFGKAIITKEVNIPNAFRVRHKDGSERILEGFGRNLLDNPVVAGFVMNARDVSERKQAEAALRTSEAQLSNALRIAHLGHWEYDVASDLFTFNDHFYAIFRTTAEKVGGYTMSSSQYAERFVHPADISIVSTEIQKAIETNDPLYSRQLEHRIIYADGETGYITVRFFIVKDDQGKTVKTYGANQDITERKRAEEYQKMVTQVLELLNKTAEKSDIIRDIILLIKELIGFEAVGVRLKEGIDFPYYHTNGFPSDFVKAERYLCARDQAGELIRDSKGNPYLECMCGNVICGRTNPALPFFTKGGSFWTNSTTELLASTTEEDRQARTRNRCHGEGYESVALIPLRSDSEIIGLLQLNDRRKGMFTLEMVSFFEKIGDGIGIALARKKAEEKILMSEEELKKRVKELEEFYNMAVTRELKMIELKKEIESLKEEIVKYKKE